MKINRFLVLLALSLGGLGVFVLAQALRPRVLVAPEMLVSRDGDFPHVELILAANPKNVKNLVGGAITLSYSGRITILISAGWERFS